jgi:hypothetical protein
MKSDTRLATMDTWSITPNACATTMFFITNHHEFATDIEPLRQRGWLRRALEATRARIEKAAANGNGQAQPAGSYPYLLFLSFHSMNKTVRFPC